MELKNLMNNMKKLLGILVLGLFLSSNVYATIFRCEINPNHQYVIKANSEDE